MFPSNVTQRGRDAVTARYESPRHGVTASLRRSGGFAFLLFTFAFAGCGVRFDMQDQPRYKPYKKSTFFADGRGSRDLVPGTVARGQLRENKGFYTGQVDNPDLNTPVQTIVDASGNTLVTSFPNAIDTFPIPVTKEMIDRGQDRYNIHCIVCHGPLGNADGMVVRRGFPQPPTYHDDRLRNAPVGHFFDVMTNGWGRMGSYAYQIKPADRWAIVAYIRALQLGQDPERMLSTGQAPVSNTEPPQTVENHGGKP